MRTTLTPTHVIIIRSLLQQELLARGHSTRVEDGALVRDSDGAVYGLDNLVLTCAQVPSSRWKHLVHDFADKLDDASVTPDILTGLTWDEARAGVHLRLQPMQALLWPEHMTYARRLGPDLVEVLMLKRGGALVTLNDDTVQRLGADALREAGLANLIASPFGEWVKHPLAGGSQIHLLRGDSGFTASRALVVPDLLRRTIGRGEQVALPYGALVCVPSRHTLGLHVLGHPGALSALRWLMALGLHEHPVAPYPLSPAVHWWHEGTLHQVSGVIHGVDLEIGTVHGHLPYLLADESFEDTMGAVLGRPFCEALAEED
jgi:hypothetical protein